MRRPLEVADRVDSARDDRVGALLEPQLQRVAPLRRSPGRHVGVLPATARPAEAAVRPEPLALLAHAPADRKRHACDLASALRSAAPVARAALEADAAAREARAPADRRDRRRGVVAAGSYPVHGSVRAAATGGRAARFARDV